MKRGFTLIEIIMYLALFSILIGGAAVAAYSVFESSQRSMTRSLVQEEGTFIMGKIGWAISGSQAINLPATHGTLLSVNRVTSLFAGLPVTDTVVVGLSGTDVQITEGAGTPSTLNSSNVQVTRLSFLHTQASGNGLNPESVEASTTVTALTPTGSVVTQDFSTIIYLRR